MCFGPVGLYGQFLTDQGICLLKDQVGMTIVDIREVC
jgi:hypothetical protein